MSAVQRFQGGVKIGSTRVAEQVGEPRAAGLDVAALSGGVARGPNSHLRPSRSWLTWARPCWCSPTARPRPQLGASPASSPHGITARSTGSAARREPVEQGEQAGVAPAGVVVAEEERHGRPRGVERVPHRAQPASSS